MTEPRLSPHAARIEWSLQALPDKAQFRVRQLAAELQQTLRGLSFHEAAEVVLKILLLYR